MMKRIFTTEVIKILTYKPFWFFIAIYMGLFLLVSLIMSSISSSITVNNMPLKFSKIFAYPYVWHTLCWVGKWFYYILGFPVILLTINEFDYRTIRQSIVNGMSRVEFTLSRYAIIICLSILACMLVIVSAVVFGKPIEDNQIFSMVAPQFLLAFFIQGIGYLGFALLVSIYLKRAVIAAGVFLIWPLIAEPIMGWILDHQLKLTISQWLPCHIFSSVISSPFGVITSGGPFLTPDFFTSGISMAYSVVMFILVLLKIKMSDL